jgi:predicted AAA+ superfamily ATPase
MAKRPAPRYRGAMTDPLLARIADALERIAPVPAIADPASGHWFVWSAQGLDAVPPPRALPLELYAGVDAQKAALHENARRHAHGLPAHDVLLWGSRGMGKSSLVRAVHAGLIAAGHDVAMVQVGQPDLASLPQLFTRLAGVPRRFTVFLDDLALDGDTGEVHALRSLLDGGVMARPDHVRLAVTSNRRNLVPQAMAENADAVSARDVLDDRLALADRFGLKLGFHVCDQPTYLAMCQGYATAFALPFDAAAALAFAAGRGARSGRVAWQFTVETAGAAGKVLKISGN